MWICETDLYNNTLLRGLVIQIYEEIKALEKAY